MRAPARTEADLPWPARTGGSTLVLVCALVLLALGLLRLALGQGMGAVPTLVIATVLVGVQLGFRRLRRRGVDVVADRHSPEVRWTMGLSSGAFAVAALAGAVVAVATGSPVVGALLAGCGLACLAPVVVAMVDPRAPGETSHRGAVDRSGPTRSARPVEPVVRRGGGR